MPNIENSEFPDFFTEQFVGNPWVMPRSKVSAALLRLFTRPDCPGGVAADYRRVTIPSLDKQAWPRLKGADQDGSPALVIKRNWRHAAVLALDGVAELERVYGQESVWHGLARIAHNGETHAGLLPAGVRFGSYPLFDHETDGPEEPPQHTLMYRTGSFMYTEVATPALFVPERGTLYLPIKPFVLQEHVPIAGGNPWTEAYGTPVV